MWSKANKNHFGPVGPVDSSHFWSLKVETKRRSSKKTIAVMAKFSVDHQPGFTSIEPDTFSWRLGDQLDQLGRIGVGRGIPSWVPKNLTTQRKVHESTQPQVEFVFDKCWVGGTVSEPLWIQYRNVSVFSLGLWSDKMATQRHFPSSLVWEAMARIRRWGWTSMFFGHTLPYTSPLMASFAGKMKC